MEYAILLQINAAKEGLIDVRRAQLSLETLIVFLLFVFLLGTSYVTISKIQEKASQRARLEMAKSSFAELSWAIQEACILGEGNVRQVRLYGMQANLSSNGTSYNFSTGKFFAQANSSCQIVVQLQQQSSNFLIQNKNGKIIVLPYQ
ncbi:MAG: hypothetical protein QXN37_03385 [Candidatus Anstonellaceae archaeon]